VTQQPAARDLRTIIAAMNVIVDLERMGDQAKGIAKVVPHLLKHPGMERPPELRQMGEIVGKMLADTMTRLRHQRRRPGAGDRQPRRCRRYALRPGLQQDPAADGESRALPKRPIRLRGAARGA
jgi:hypothetical protein